MELILVLFVTAGAIAAGAVYIAGSADKAAHEALYRATQAYDWASECSKMNLELREEVKQLRALIPEDIKEERTRREVLLRELNDEMERGLDMERRWNDGLSNILNYNGTAQEGTNNE